MGYENLLSLLHCEDKITLTYASGSQPHLVLIYYPSAFPCSLALCILLLALSCVLLFFGISAHNEGGHNYKFFNSSGPLRRLCVRLMFVQVRCVTRLKAMNALLFLHVYVLLVFVLIASQTPTSSFSWARGLQAILAWRRPPVLYSPSLSLTS